MLDIPANKSTETNEEAKENPKFSILSYNILAECYAMFFLSEIERNQLLFESRCHKVVENIKELNPDIFVL